MPCTQACGQKECRIRKELEFQFTSPAAGTLRDAALHSAILSLISAILFAFATVAIVATAYSSSHFRERNIHLAACLTVSGVAFM